MTLQGLDVAEAFDSVAGNYAEQVQDSIGFSGRDLAFFTAAKAHHLRRTGGRLARPLAEADVLDVGCGAGAVDALIRPYVGSLVGVDVSEQMLQQALLANPPGSIYLSYPGDALPFEDRSFDLVFASCVVHHVPPDRWPAFQSEMFRVVRPGGAAVIIEHNPLNPLTRRCVAECEFDADAVLTRPAPLVRTFRSLGAVDVRRRYILFTPLGRRRVQMVERRLLSWNPVGAQYLVEAFRSVR